MKALVVLSGGMDSTTLLYRCLRETDEVEAISFNYGQRHSKELTYAAATCARLSVKHTIVDLSCLSWFLRGSALTDQTVKVPHGHYEDESMKQTVVPNRNMIMLSIAAAYAIANSLDTIATAVHAGDHAIYPDCRPAFLSAVGHAISVGNYNQISVWSPYINMTKSQIAAEGLRHHIDYDRDTWSCYEGGRRPCGKCGTCVERIEALEEARRLVGG